MRAFGVILLLVSAVAAQGVTVDGRLDEAVWGTAVARPMGERDHIHPNYREQWDGVADLSAVVRTVVAGNDLFLGIEVRDEARMHVGNDFWLGDSIEVFLDTDLQSKEPADRYTADDIQLFLMPFHRGLRWGVVARGPGKSYPDGGLAGVLVAHTEHAGGYTLEAKIPLDRVGPVRPNAKGEIGFDIAINDVDEPGATQAQTYMTLSGRFELYNTPRNFGRLAVGPRPVPAVEPGPTPGTDWTALWIGLAALALAVWGARMLGHRMARQGRVRTVALCAGFFGAAVALMLLPAVVGWLDARGARQAATDALAAAESAAQAFLDLDAGTSDAQPAKLRALFRDGQVRLRPRYRYHVLPVSGAGNPAGASIHYGIALAPGETRSFPLQGRPSPDRVRLDVAQPDPGERGRAAAPAAEVTLMFEEGPALVAEGRSRIEIACGPQSVPLRAVTVRNVLSSQTLIVDGLYALHGIAWSPLPLATPTQAGVPLDVWHDAPASHIVTVASNTSHTIGSVGLAGHRLWIALGTDGAYPASPYGAPVARLRVLYRGDAPGPTLTIRNGQDVFDRGLAYGRPGVAMEWEDSHRLPNHYTLHALALDPNRTVERIAIDDLGVLQALRVAAATMGRRESTAPPPSSGLVLRGDNVSVRPAVKELWSGLGFSVRTGNGTPHATGPVSGVLARIELGDTVISVSLPHRRWAIAFQRGRGGVFLLAALLLALAAVAGAAGLLQRSRHLRSKMLVALGAATVVPLLFLFFSLTFQLNEQAEGLLEKATRADLRSLQDRVESGKARARTLASRARDRLEFVRPRGSEALGHVVREARAEVVAQGGFLRVPELDGGGPSALGNVSFVDSVARSGLYYSPWDGLLAMGVARSVGQRRYFVGVFAAALIGEQPAEDVEVVLYGPDGTPVASTPGLSARRRERLRASLQQRVGAQYERNDGERAAAHAVLRDGGRVVGMLGVYRSRAPTEAHKSATFRTLLLAGLGALLLVFLAGGTLVDRVASRLGRVTVAARSIARGELDSRVPVEAADEVGRLAASFNRMADALAGRVRQMTELQRGLEQLTAALDRTEVARAAADLLGRATGAKRVLVASLDRTTERLETLHQVGEGAPLGVRLPDEGPARDAVSAREPVLREGALFLPLVASGHTVGLAVCSPVEQDLEPDRNFLDLSGRQIGIALENARLYRAAVTDELTGLYTYAFFVRRLKEEVDRANAVNRPLSLLRLVIDNYAALARSHGAAHAARLVAETAATVGEVLPPRNMVARREAGELLVLLVESDADDAAAHRNAIAAALDRKELDAGCSYRSVTYPRDGAAADILLDALFLVTETFEELAADQGPALKVPTGLLVGQGPTMRAALDVVARVAPTNATVLLSGETGTGKEVLADLVQGNSDRRDRPYVKVNCAAIPEALIESELFGHERGAFTGADRRRIGRFEEAHGGTLFLDEIGELPLPMQATLLRVLQEGRLRRVGGSASIRTDVRILAASNRDLAAAVSAGQFRDDLFHRLHVIELIVPPLRNRREEIPGLIQHFREEFNRRHGLAVDSFSPDALDALYEHDWPGNVRELKNVIERAMVMAGGAEVRGEHLALPDGAGRQPPAAIDGLTPRQERILESARAGGGITNSDVVSGEEVSARTALRELQALVERGLLVRVGRRRGAIYRPRADGL